MMVINPVAYIVLHRSWTGGLREIARVVAIQVSVIAVVTAVIIGGELAIRTVRGSPGR